MYRLIILLLALCAFSASAQERTPAPENAELYFISPVDGATVSNPVIVRFGLRNMGVAPAGIKYDNSGHHHLLVDTALPALEFPIINDGNHLHFGGGQTETALELSPGEHTLQLLLGDFAHIPHDPAVMSERITITVE